MVSVSEETMQTNSQLRPLIASVSFSRLDLRYQAPTANLEGNFALGTKGLGGGGGSSTFTKHSDSGVWELTECLSCACNIMAI